MKSNDDIERSKASADIARATRAETIINDPIYIEAVTAMKAAMFTEFENTKLANEDERHELWQRMQLMKQFQGRFEAILKQGAKAKQTITMLDRAKQLIR